MAFWDKVSGAGNVEDRRGMSPVALGGGGLGLIGVGIILLLNFLSTGNVDLNSVLSTIQQSGGVSQQTDTGQFAGLDDYEKFTSTVLGSTNTVWHEVFTNNGKEYTEPKVVLFRTSTQSACGGASSQMGPHYCPNDQTIYIDETFFDELKQLGGGNGDVAQAYVIAHEVGHHVQNQLGTFDEVRGSGNEQSVELELQADCFAGVWAHSLQQQGVFEQGEIKEATDAAAAVGDDHIQQATGGGVNPETWTHGSAAQRVQWFDTGYGSGDPAQCDTFNG